MPWEVFLGTSGAELRGRVGRPTLGAESDFHPEKKARMVLVDKKPRSTKQKGLWSPAWRCRQPKFSPSLPLNVEESSFSSPFLCRSDAFGHRAAFWGLGASGLGLTRSSTRQGPRLRGTSPVFPLPASLSAISEIPAPSIFFPPGLSCVCWRQRSRSGWLRFLTVHLVLIWS